jgi:predicted GH43/DUF377 family glycosyl hydrolase
VCNDNCPGYEPTQDESDDESEPAANLVPQKITKIDSADLMQGKVGTAFNSSIIRYQGKLLLAHRTGWMGSQIWIAELNEDYKPNGINYQLKLDTANSNYGREDPRLFVFRGKLHISFTGVKGLRRSKNITTRQLYVSLNDDFGVDKIYTPDYCQNDSMLWQKNWQFFEWKNELYCVYSIEPHVILKVNGNRCSIASYSNGKFNWSGGHKRGGCPPILVNGLFYHWFHGAVDIGSQWPTRQYNYSVYTFDPMDNFSIVHTNETPLYYADNKTRPPDQYCSVVFNSGCIFENNNWIISNGIHDRWNEIHEWDKHTIDSYLGIKDV